MPGEFAFYYHSCPSRRISICHSSDLWPRLNLSHISASTFLVHVDVYICLYRDFFRTTNSPHYSQIFCYPLPPPSQPPPVQCTSKWRRCCMGFTWKLLFLENWSFWCNEIKCMPSLATRLWWYLHSDTRRKGDWSPFTTYKHALHQPADLRIVESKGPKPTSMCKFRFLFSFSLYIA